MTVSEQTDSRQWTIWRVLRYVALAVIVVVVAVAVYIVLLLTSF